MRLKTLLFGCCASDSRTADVDTTVKNSDAQSNKASKDRENNTTENGQSSKLLKISPEEITKAPLLILTAIEGNILTLNSEIIMNAGGIATGGRNKKDGVIYLGSQKYKLSTKTGQQRLMNDILLNDASVGERHCMLKYNPATKKYYIKDLGEGSGTFVKIDQELKLKSGYIVSFSDSHLVLSINDKNSNPNSPLVAQNTPANNAITLKFLDGPKIDQVFTFPKEERLVKIGRMNDCNVKFEGNSLSRYQCTIEYKDSNWFIMDGLQGKASTNGSWLFVEEFYEIFDGVTLKIGQTLFKICVKAQG